MKTAALAGVATCLAVVAPWAWGVGPAAGLDCTSRRLGEADTAVCQDAQLSRSEQQVGARINAMARKLSFGQYLGVRHWHAGWAGERGRCGANRSCLAASYRAQLRFLDRLQQCLDTGSPRRACLRNTLNVEREAAQRR